MITIPTAEKQFGVSNKSDLLGNISYTKCMNFDEKGYIKLSPRAVMLLSEEDDVDFDIPLSYGRQVGNDFLIVTADNPYKLTMSDFGISIIEDTDGSPPNLTFDSQGRWFNNKWHATSDTKLYTKTGSVWTDTAVALTSGKAHPLEVFRNQNEIAVGNGNTVKLLDTTYSVTQTLTLPSDYEVVGFAYLNNEMAVITRLADSVAGQNQEAFVFLWDGASPTAENGGFPCGSDALFGICTFKNSYAILTRKGELKKFNGGGFETVASFPFVITDAVWGDSLNRETYGDTMVADGDKLLINIGSRLSNFGINQDSYVQGNHAGVWCYDEDIGLYHKYAPSISQFSLLTVTDANVDIASDTFTISSGSIPDTGTQVKYVFDSATVISGLGFGGIYYVIKVDATRFRLAATYDDAIAANAFPIASVGASINKFIGLNIVDYGQNVMERSGGIGLTDKNQSNFYKLLFGGETFDKNSSVAFAALCLLIDGFKNVGYFVTSKLTSNNITDQFQKAIIRFRPLGDDDEIIVKSQERELYGFPLTTRTIAKNQCTWISDTQLTTTVDLSLAKDYLDDNGDNELECEFISGAGAGQLEQITDIEESAGTYTVTVENSVVGGVNGNKCDILINNWKVFDTITSDDNATLYKQIQIGEASTELKSKCVTKGINVTIMEFKLINPSNEDNE